MISATQFTVSCPSCLVEFPVDPEKVPVEGVHAICSACLRVFPVHRPAENGSGEAAVAGLDIPESGQPAVAEPEAPDPGERAVAVPEAPESREPAVAEPADPAPFEDLTSLASEALSEPDDASTRDSGDTVSSSLSVAASRFGSRSPEDRARRLARVLVSDIIAYHPARYRESLSRGSLKEDFEDEVAKSWKEYVDQVGEELAESTPYFTEALNEILAKGADVF